MQSIRVVNPVSAVTPGTGQNLHSSSNTASYSHLVDLDLLVDGVPLSSRAGATGGRKIAFQANGVCEVLVLCASF